MERQRHWVARKGKKSFIAPPHRHQAGNPSRTVTSACTIISGWMMAYVLGALCDGWWLMVVGLWSSDCYYVSTVEINLTTIFFVFLCTTKKGELVDAHETLSYIMTKICPFYSFKLTWSIAVIVGHESWKSIKKLINRRGERQ